MLLKFFVSLRGSFLLFEDCIARARPKRICTCNFSCPIARARYAITRAFIFFIFLSCKNLFAFLIKKQYIHCGYILLLKCIFYGKLKEKKIARQKCISIILGVQGIARPVISSLTRLLMNFKENNVPYFKLNFDNI